MKRRCDVDSWTRQAALLWGRGKSEAADHDGRDIMETDGVDDGAELMADLLDAGLAPVAENGGLLLEELSFAPLGPRRQRTAK
jgi:hypothetical protein